MKYKNRIAVLLLSVLLLCALSLTVYAHETLKKGAEGTITVEMKYDGKAVIGGTLAVYRVGKIQESDGNYSFVKTDTMGTFDDSYDDINSAALAENIAAFVQANNLSVYDTAENIEGNAVFPKLELGLYLIVQTKASDGYEPLKPFLVSVPMNKDGHYGYEVNAEGKFQLHQEPKPTTPPTPSEPKLPQTGQFNWPVPVLAVLGLSLFSMGWMLRFGRKKNRYEK